MKSEDAEDDLEVINKCIEKEGLSIGLLLRDSTVIEKASLKATVAVYELANLIESTNLKHQAWQHLCKLASIAKIESIIPIYILAIKSSDEKLEEIALKRAGELLAQPSMAKLSSVYSTMRIVLPKNDTIITDAEDKAEAALSEAFPNSIAALVREMIINTSDS